ncbi:hypothetical protein KIN20_018907, partial [Parelaphostrongylus tenuis]
NLVKLHGMVFSDRDVMVVMELVSGGGLDSYLKKKTLVLERLKSPYFSRITQIPTAFSSYQRSPSFQIAERLVTLRLGFHRDGGDV